MTPNHLLKTVVSILTISVLVQSCIVLPKTVPEEDQECLLVTKSMTIDYYTTPDMIDGAVDEMLNVLSSDCHEPECLIIFAPLISISVGSWVVSGSIVVTGNTIHWLERQGRCDDAMTQQALTVLRDSAKMLGGMVIKTGIELIEWFQRQTHPEKEKDLSK